MSLVTYNLIPSTAKWREINTDEWNGSGVAVELTDGEKHIEFTQEDNLFKPRNDIFTLSVDTEINLEYVDDITGIEDALRNWVIAITGLTCIFAWPGASKPDEPYVLINIMDFVSEGTEEIVDETNTKSAGVYDVLVSLNTYKTSAYSNALKLNNSLKSRRIVKDYFIAENLGYTGSTGIRKITDVVNAVPEERAQFDLNFMYRTQTTQGTGAIEKVELTNGLDGSLSTITS